MCTFAYINSQDTALPQKKGRAAPSFPSAVGDVALGIRKEPGRTGEIVQGGSGEGNCTIKSDCVSIHIDVHAQICVRLHPSIRNVANVGRILGQWSASYRRLIHCLLSLLGSHTGGSQITGLDGDQSGQLSCGEGVGKAHVCHGPGAGFGLDASCFGHLVDPVSLSKVPPTSCGAGSWGRFW